MIRVHKYGPLPVGTPLVVHMPGEARLLHFGAQGHNLYVWAEVELDRPGRGRHLLVVGTGHEKPAGGVHVGTWVSDRPGEPYVWHLFDFGGMPPL